MALAGWRHSSDTLLLSLIFFFFPFTPSTPFFYCLLLVFFGSPRRVRLVLAKGFKKTREQEQTRVRVMNAINLF